MNLLKELLPNVFEFSDYLLLAIRETIIMVGISGAIGLLAGLLSGIWFVVSAEGGLYANRIANQVLGRIIDTIRSIPFVILIALMVPVTRLIVGTSIGVPGAIVPMTLGIVPLMSRLVEQALWEVDKGVLEAARAMGLSRRYIVVHVLLAEAMPGLVRSVVTGTISLIGLSAMAGTVGGGGLGNFAIRYGYARYMTDITIVTVLILLIVVNLLQNFGGRAAKKLSR